MNRRHFYLKTMPGITHTQLAGRSIANYGKASLGEKNSKSDSGPFKGNCGRLPDYLPYLIFLESRKKKISVSTDCGY